MGTLRGSDSNFCDDPKKLISENVTKSESESKRASQLDWDRFIRLCKDFFIVAEISFLHQHAGTSSVPSEILQHFPVAANEPYCFASSRNFSPKSVRFETNGSSTPIHFSALSLVVDRLGSRFIVSSNVSFSPRTD